MAESEAKLKRKAEISRVAWKLFLDSGYRETTMADIAKAAGLSRKTLYQYFKSREEIALEIEVGLFRDFIGLMDEHLPKLSGNGYQKAVRYFELIEQNIDGYKEAIQFTGLFDFQIKGRYAIEPPVEAFIKLIAKAGSYLKNILEEGIKDGSVCNTLDPVITSEAINDSWLYLAQRVYARPDSINNGRQLLARNEITQQLRLFQAALKNNVWQSEAESYAE